MTKINSKTRILALFLALLTIFNVLPMTASATTIEDGSKTASMTLGPGHFYLKTTAGTALGAWEYTYTTNEMFSQRSAKEAVRESVAAALAAEAPQLSLPAIEAQLRAVQERHQELLGLAMAANPDDTSYDTELQKICSAKAQLLMLKAEMEHAEQTCTEYDNRMKQVNEALELDSGAITKYDEIMVRQLISNIKVLDATTILVRFKDGTEIEQRIERTKGARAS